MEIPVALPHFAFHTANLEGKEFEMIAAKNPQIEKAVGILMDLSADERTRLLEESRQKALRDYNSRMKDKKSIFP